MLKLLRLCQRLFGLKQAFRAVVVLDDPDAPCEGTLYLVGDKAVFWKAVLKCPCGCGTVIQLPMDDARSTNWKIVSDSLIQPTLVPSIDRTAGCRSHFLLRQGKIIWC